MPKPDHFYWMATDSGRIIDLLNPDPNAFTIEDIAAQLSKLCRFNGALKTFYSVAEHCIHVSRMCPPQYKKQGLLHDAAEAFICDVPTPLKKLLGKAYTDIEDRITGAIQRKFNVELIDLPDVVKAADRALVVTERDRLQTKPISWGPAYEESIRYPALIGQLTDPKKAERAYLDEWDNLPGQHVRPEQKKSPIQQWMDRNNVPYPNQASPLVAFAGRGGGTRWDPLTRTWVHDL